MKADRCDIYTDVDGVYTTDPRIVPRARKLPIVTYEEMLELASVGAKVLQTRSVGLAMRYNMPLQVLSSFEDRPGTLIVARGRAGGLWHGTATHHRHRLRQERGAADPDRPARRRPAPRRRFSARSPAGGINVDMIAQGQPERDHLHRARGRRSAQAADVLEKDKGGDRLCDARHRHRRSARSRSSASASAPIPASPRGCSRRSAERKIDILAIATSEIKVSVLIPEDYTELAVRVLHTAFGLDAEDAA